MGPQNFIRTEKVAPVSRRKDMDLQDTVMTTLKLPAGNGSGYDKGSWPDQRGWLNGSIDLMFPCPSWHGAVSTPMSFLITPWAWSGLFMRRVWTGLDPVIFLTAFGTMTWRFMKFWKPESLDFWFERFLPLLGIFVYRLFSISSTVYFKDHR